VVTPLAFREVIWRRFSNAGPITAFAAGGDDNVIVKRTGNSILKTTDIITWKDKNTANATGRFVRQLRDMGYRPGTAGISVFGNATGIGKTMCDLIRESGIAIMDFNFGGRSRWL
jgi:hypothetical protein